jgi:hypothetical protein
VLVLPWNERISVEDGRAYGGEHCCCREETDPMTNFADVPAGSFSGANKDDEALRSRHLWHGPHRRGLPEWRSRMCPALTLAAVCDIEESRAIAMGERFGAPYYRNAEALLSSGPSSMRC